MEPDVHQPIRSHLTALIALVILLFVVATLGSYLALRAGNSGARSFESLLPEGTPAPTANDYTSAQKGFDYLVQLTDNGIHPATLTIQKGKTVRFTNLSSSGVRLAGPHYDAAKCPSDEIDTCTLIVRGGYWEHTFASAGTYTYTNGNGANGTITVK